MWGCISTEASYQLNFNTSFSTTRSDVLVHLAQWQYWWWFWFAFLWCFYYLFVSKVVRFRTLNMKPKIVTSYRPHGKWGDFLAAIIPGLWCLNILTNSNFILRLLEWQNESSLFVVRIRARQWYWIYKFEMKNLIDILSVPKNLGRNKWFFSNFSDYHVSDNYFHILQLRVKSRNIENYWNTLFNKISNTNKVNITGLSEKLNFNNSEFNNFTTLNKFFFFNNIINTKNSWSAYDTVDNDFFSFSGNFINNNNYKSILNFSSLNNLFKDKTNFLNLNNFFDGEGSSRFLKRGQGLSLPLRLMKYPLTSDLNNFVEDNNFNLFKIRFNSGFSDLKVKPLNDVFFYTIKQVKYKRRISLPMVYKYEKTNTGQKTSKKIYQGYPILLNNSIFKDYISNPEDVYNLVKKNKIRDESIPVVLAKRIIRTRRTLVLPAHCNITLITNSFDVVHSWYIPGLGLKLDCVPGRSTHHTLYIDSVGFYYGQCAEICGRYHHHMPIRVCALPFEHFLIWWNIFGLPRVMFTNNQHRFQSNYALRKFVW